MGDKNERSGIGLACRPNFLLPGLRSVGDQFILFEAQRNSHTRGIAPLQTVGIRFEIRETISGGVEPPTDVPIVLTEDRKASKPWRETGSREVEIRKGRG